MEIKINIHDNYRHDYMGDKFKDFFSRVMVDIDNKGMCGNYEKEIAEMFLKAFDESIENPDRCDSRMTNADRIRNMTDEELLDFICSIETYEEGSVKTIENGVSMHTVTEVRNWLQSEAE